MSERSAKSTFAFEIGDRPYLVDSLTRASRSVFRVVIVDRESVASINRYYVVPVRVPDTMPVLVREDDLSLEPHAAGLDRAQRARWGTQKKGAKDKSKRINRFIR